MGFIGVGDDTGNGDVLYAIPDSDFNSGYHIGPNDNFLAWADIVNYNKNATKIYLAYEIEYTPGIVGVNTRDVLLSVTGCNMKAVKTSAMGPTNTTSEKWVFYEDGNLVIARKLSTPKPLSLSEYPRGLMALQEDICTMAARRWPCPSTGSSSAHPRPVTVMVVMLVKRPSQR